MKKKRYKLAVISHEDVMYRMVTIVDKIILQIFKLPKK